MTERSPSAEFLGLLSAVAGRYSLEYEIGRGGMGIVFLAHDVTLDRPVAIKLLPPAMAQQATLRERFLQEARTAAKLSHPNIIPIFSVEEVGEFVFFVMAYVRGETLGQRVHDKGPLKPDAATEIIREVTWALAYAHAQGVIHRDVKPDNILLEEASGRVLVTDFGIAQIADSGAVDEPAEILGTPDFMSPEQATGEPVDARSDIYSLGATAFFTVAGHPPFSAPSSAELLAHHIRTPAPSLAAAAPAVPRTLARVVERCLAKEPGDRFQSGEALAEALAGTVVVKKETPVAVRLFVKQTKQWRERGYNLLYPLLGVYFGGMVLAAGNPGATVVGAGIVAASLAAPFFSTVRRTRRVLKAGFEQADIARALQDDLGSLDEELRFLYGDNYAVVAKRWRNAALAGIAGAAAGIAGMFMGVPEAGFTLAASSIGLTVIARGQMEKRTTKGAARRLKHWRGRFGRWVCALAGRGLKRKAETPSLTHRPTEMAIGMAVSSLFKSLPKAVRADMSDLPDVVERLEADAQRLRDQINGFDSLLAVAETSPTSVRGDDTLAGQRQRAIDRLRAAQQEAQLRFSETVAALEKLRVDLLRIRAGAVNVASVTANLGSARDLGAQIDRLLAAQEEIEEELKQGS